jgi:hypothetical protein
MNKMLIGVLVVVMTGCSLDSPESILADFVDLSDKYGTDLTIRDGRAILEFDGNR